MILSLCSPPAVLEVGAGGPCHAHCDLSGPWYAEALGKSVLLGVDSFFMSTEITIFHGKLNYQWPLN